MLDGDKTTNKELLVREIYEFLHEAVSISEFTDSGLSEWTIVMLLSERIFCKELPSSYLIDLAQKQIMEPIDFRINHPLPSIPSLKGECK